MAGGKGIRLRPYTTCIPKPLLPIGERPVLEIIILQLKNHGFDHITISVNHLADLIMAFFGKGEKLGVKIDYVMEDTPLSTLGALTLINDLPETFLVINGDNEVEIHEVKGFWRDDAKKKFKLFKQKYPKVNINVLQQKDLQKLGVLK